VDAALGIDVGDLLVKPSCTGPYLPDTFQQFIKVVSAKSLALLQTLVIEHKAFDNVLPEGSGGPNAELCCLVAVDPVANCNDGVQVVKIHFTRHLTVSFHLNYSKS